MKTLTWILCFGIIVLGMMMANCTHADVGIAPTPKTEVVEEEVCLKETSELGYCTLNYKYEGVYNLISKSQWNCSCSQEEMEDSKIIPECCTWNDSSTEGYVNITPISTYSGNILIHHGNIAFFATYEIRDDGSWYIKRGFTKVGNSFIHYPKHYSVELNDNILEFSTAYPVPAFEEVPKTFRLDFSVQIEKVGEVGTCFKDTPDMKFGHCHGNQNCQRLVGGCTTEDVCHKMVEKLSFTCSSWQEPGSETCNYGCYSWTLSVVGY